MTPICAMTRMITVSLSLLLLCDRSTLTVDGNVRIVWFGLNISTSTVLMYLMFRVSSPKLTAEI